MSAEIAERKFQLKAITPHLQAEVKPLAPVELGRERLGGLLAEGLLE